MQVTIHHVPDLNGNPTPARCNRRTGEICINDSVWKKIPPAHRMFILLHEYGHIALDSSDELEVDAFAMKHYVQMGYSLSDSVKALSQVLTGKSPSHVDRVRRQLERAKEIDKLNKNTMCRTSNLACAGSCECSHNFTGNPVPWYNQTADDFEGCDAGKLKPRQYRKCVKAVGKAQTKVNKSEGTKALKEGKGAAAQVKAEAKRILADQGIVDQTGLSGAVRAAGEALRSPASPEPMSASGGSGSSKIFMWVGIGVATLALLGTIIFFINKKR